jgi:hypothetical protein
VTGRISCEEICTPRKADFGQVIFSYPCSIFTVLLLWTEAEASGPVAAPQTPFADVGSKARKPPKDMLGDATSWDPSDWVSGISPYAADVLAREAVSDWSTVSQKRVAAKCAILCQWGVCPMEIGCLVLLLNKEACYPDA